MPKGTLVIRAAELLGRPDPAVLRPPAARPGRARAGSAWSRSRASASRWPRARSTCTDGMVVRTQLTSPGRREGAARRDGAAAHQPPARLPGVRQGRRVPAAEPGDVATGRARSASSRRSGTSRSRSRSVDQVLLDRERCILCARCTRFADEIAGDPLIDFSSAAPTTQVIDVPPTSRSTRTSPATRCRSARSARSPAPPTGSGPGRSTWCPRPACASTARRAARQRTDHRRGKVTRRLAGDDPQVNEEWNCDKGRWAFTYATQPDRITTPLVRDEDGVLRPGVLAGGARGRRQRAWPPRAAGPACSSAAGSPSRTPTPTPSSPGSRSAPTTSTSAPARTPPRRPSSWPRTWPGRDLEVTLRRPGEGPGGAAGRVRARGGVADRLPAAAQGGPQARTRASTRIAPLASPGLAKMSGALLPTVPGGEAAVAGPGWPEAPGLIASAGRRPPRRAGRRRRDHPGRRAARRGAGRALRLPTGWPRATGARLAWVPRRAGERGAIEAGALPNLLPVGRPVTDAAARAEVARAWDVAALPDAPGPRHRASSPPRPTGELDALVVGGRRPVRPGRPGRRLRGAGGHPVRGQPGDCAPARSPTAPTWCCRSRRWWRRPARS